MAAAGVPDSVARHIIRQVLLALSFLHNLEEAEVYHLGEQLSHQRRRTAPLPSPSSGHKLSPASPVPPSLQICAQPTAS